jgi:methyl-accepting chemotaxis protein
MKWFVDLSTRVKLVLSFGLMVFLLLVVITTAYRGLVSLYQSQEALFQQDFLSSIALVQLLADQNRVRAELLEMMMIKDRDKQLKLEEDIRERAKAVDAGLDLVAEAVRGFPGEAKQFAELVSILADYRKTRDEQFSLISQDNSDEAQRLGTTVQEERYGRIRTIAKELGDSAIGRAKERIAGAEKKTAKLFRTFLVISILVLVLSGGAVLFLNRIIATPLKEITVTAGRIARGDLGVVADSKGREDEVGHLGKAFGAMIGYLQGMAAVSGRIAAGDLTVTIKPASDQDVLGNAFVAMTGYLQAMAAVSKQIAAGDLAVTLKPVSDQDVLGNAFADMTGYLRNMAELSKQVAAGDLTVKVKPVSERDVLGNAFADMIENLRRINQEVRDGVNVLALSASEILASTTQVASGIAETATSVSETTATVEEVKQTAQLSTEKSRNVSENAQQAALVAEQGNAAVIETMDGINHIKELMETVAESVVRLSEQTQAIGEIITVVNDLAQQSNLLAVNAAIEASKAGDQGKGFVVVAQEIKSLADQSKQATEQVRSILGDIQKATGKSVLATEQVSKAVENGVTQAAESGESIRKLAESIGASAQAAAQIAASSQQQLAGMEQVAMAMESIKLAAQQNASGTKQAEQAAHTLNELGQKLKEMVGRYKV